MIITKMYRITVTAHQGTEVRRLFQSEWLEAHDFVDLYRGIEAIGLYVIRTEDIDIIDAQFEPVEESTGAVKLRCSDHQSPSGDPTLR